MGGLVVHFIFVVVPALKDKQEECIIIGFLEIVFVNVL